MIAVSVPALAGELLPVGDAPSPKENPATKERVELGHMLFFDRRLSGDGTMNCATCHMPDMGFSDGLPIALNYPTTRNWRNSPTLINTAFMKFLFHDGRAASLEEQALFPVMSAFEMNQNLDFVVEEIRIVPEYVGMFEKAFGGEVTKERIAYALAAFQRTLISVNSPLDKYLKGDKKALSDGARKGFEIFIGKGKCSECHFGVNLADEKFHALYVPENPEQEKDPRVAATRRFVAKVSGYEDFRTLNEDPGRYLVTRDKKDWKAFKTPTLREINETDPYMHNGIFRTLDEVIEFINHGGGAGNTALKPLGLTKEEAGLLKTFLVEGLNGDPLYIRTPRIPD